MAARRLPTPFLFGEGIPSPCYLLDEDQLVANCAILDSIQKDTGVKILLALKAFSAWSLFPLLSRAGSGPLWGTCASSVDEARLGREEFGGEVHAYAAAFEEEEIAELLPLCDHLTLNSLAQWRRFAAQIQAYNATSAKPVHVGLRINPEHSEGTVPLYDPCDPSSRLGIRRRDFDPTVFEEGISGLHLHTLCEQGAEAFAHTLTACEKTFGPELARSRFLNFGGGHHITAPDYNRPLLCEILKGLRSRYSAHLYLEPGEAVALDAGWLTAKVLDIVYADMPVAILNVSVTCHMPDVLEMPYRPPLFYWHDGHVCETNEEEGAYGYRLAGHSCLAGDVIPYTFGFARKLCVGDCLVFGDMAIYTMVKSTTFNGLRHPSIARFTGDNVSMIRRFGYEDFKGKLS